MYYYSIFKANKNHQWLIKCDDNYLLEVSYIKDIKTFSQELLTDISHQNALIVKVKEELKEYIH